jgi:hypothetical protein
MIPNYDEKDRFIGYGPWSLRYFYDQCTHNEWFADGESATGFYPEANAANVCDVTGVPFRCCPRFYIEGASARVKALVKRARRFAFWKDGGSLGAVTTLPLIPVVVDLIELESALKTYRDKRDHEEKMRGLKAGR